MEDTEVTDNVVVTDVTWIAVCNRLTPCAG
jgi:hypothetical protein